MNLKGGLRKGRQNFVKINEQLRQEIALREEAELKYRTIFETTPVSIWEMDFSEVKLMLDKLRAQGLVDIREYLDNHPELLREAISMIRGCSHNATVMLHGASSKKMLLKFTQ